MVAKRTEEAEEGEGRAITPFDAASYIYLLIQEMRPIARGAGFEDIVAALDEVQRKAASALERLGQGGA